MKRTLTLLSRYLCVVACVLLAVSCSDKAKESQEQKEDLIKLIGDNATVAGFASLDAVLESIDIVDGKVPADLSDIGDEDFDEAIQTITSIKGFDSNSILFLAYEKGHNVACVSTILDEDELKSSLSAAGFDVDGDVYEYEGLFVVIREGRCWFVAGDQDATETVNALINEAESKPLAGWKKEQLQALCDKRFCAFGAIEGNYVFFSGDLTGNSCDMAFKALDANGKPFIEVADNAGIASLGKYVDRNATFGAVFPGLSVFPQLQGLMQMAEMSEYLQYTTLKAAVNVNINKPESTAYYDPSYGSVQVALEATPGNAANLLSLITTTIEQESGLVSTGDETHREFSYGLWRVTFDVEGDFVVARYGNTNISQALDCGNGQLVKAVANVPAHMASVNNPFGYTAEFKMDSESITIHCEIKDTDKSFIHALMYMAFSMEKSYRNRY